MNQNTAQTPEIQTPQPPTPEPKKKSRKPLYIICTIVFFILLLMGSFLTLNWYIRNQELKNNQIACTADAKICPDGSAVGRVAPSCEFAPCPTASPQAEPTVTLDPQTPISSSPDKTYLGHQICQTDSECVNGEKCLEVGIGALKPPYKTCWEEEVIPQ